MLKKTALNSSAKRVGIWIRVSTEDQARGESPEHHEQRARHYAESKGWTIVEVYHLEGVSGKTVVQHAEAKRMLKDIERGHITGLIFSKLARLGRNTRELLEFADYFEKHNADLISLQESIDPSTPSGRLFYTMIAAMAHWEREEIASRVAASVPIRAQLGKPLGGVAPYGYQWKNKKLVIHPEEAPVRKLAYELYAKHQRKKTVARLLNEMGYRARQQRVFQSGTIECIIKDPTAKGVRRANFSTRVGGTKGWDYKPESEWVFSECDPIITEELWDRCNAILSQQKSSKTPPARKPVQLFGGLTWCGLCQKKMYAKSSTPKYVCSKCNNKIATADLEDIFVEQIKEYLLSPTEISRYLEQADRTILEKKRLLEVLEKERISVQEEMDQIFKLYINNKITDDEFGVRYHPYEERKAQLGKEIPQLQAEVDFLKINLLSSDEILHQARDLYGRWPELSHEDKCQVVQTIVEKIIIGKEDIEIQLYYLPTLQEPIDDPVSNSSNGGGSDFFQDPPDFLSQEKSTSRLIFKNLARWNTIPLGSVWSRCTARPRTSCVTARRRIMPRGAMRWPT